MPKLPLLATAVIAVAFASGCACTTDRIRLEYMPMPGTQPVAQAKGVAVAVAVNDSRSDKARVGCKKNGYGCEMAPIVAEEDPATTLRTAIEAELAARGFTIAAGSAIQVKAELGKMWNDFKAGFCSADAVADLNLAVTVQSGNSIVFTKQVNVQGIEPKIMMMTGNNARIALNKAIATALQQIFADPAFVAALAKGGSA
jgi:uncharacterized lipoprotein